MGERQLIPMRRIDWYLLAEMIVPALVGGVLVLMMLIGNKLYTLLQYLYQGVKVHDVLLMLLYYTPLVLMTAIPAALLVGASLGLNRLERDRELLALRMSGVRLKRIVLPIIIIGLLASVGVFYLQENVVPRTQHKALLLAQQIGINSTAALIQEDTIKRVQNYLIYVHSAEATGDKQVLRGIMIATINNSGHYPTWITIPMAECHNGQWTLESDPATHEAIHTFAPNADSIYVMDADGGVLKLPKELFNQVIDQRTTPEEFTLRELRAALHNGVRGMSSLFDAPQLTFYINQRYAIPLAALVAVLIAVPLSIHFGRSGGYVGLLLSAVVAFCFTISQQWMQVLAEHNYLHPILAAWLPDACFGILGIVLLFREE